MKKDSKSIIKIYIFFLEVVNMFVMCNKLRIFREIK